jgi:hypothetical protein
MLIILSDFSQLMFQEQTRSIGSKRRYPGGGNSQARQTTEIVLSEDPCP